MKAARRMTPATEDMEHKERSLRRPAQGWSKKRGGSKRSKPTFKGSAGERYFQTKKSMMGRGGEKGLAGSFHEVTINRSRSKRRTQAGARQKDTSPSARPAENLLIPPRYELGVQGYIGYRRGGQNQTWNVSKIPPGTTDLSRRKYSVKWLCQRGHSNIVQDYILELPETLNKLRLSPKSQKRRYPFEPSQTSPSLRPARSTSYRCKDGAESLEMDYEFESDNKQHWEKFNIVSTTPASNACNSVSAETARPSRVAGAKPARGMHRTMSQMSTSGQPHEKEKVGTGSSTSFTDGQRAFRALKVDDVVYDPGLRSAAGPISRPQPNGQVKERDKAQRFSNSTLKGEEREWLRQILNAKLRKYSVKPHKLTIVSKTISTSLATELIPLGYVSVPSPKRNGMGLTKNEKAVLSVQHEIRKIYNAAKLEAKKNASKHRGFSPRNPPLIQNLAKC